MKKLLLIGNTVLAFLLGLSLWGAFRSGDSVKLETGRKKSARKSENAGNTASSAVKFTVPTSDEAASVIVNKNVFDPQRTGGAVGRGAVTYTLVGFYRVGSTQGGNRLLCLCNYGGLEHCGSRILYRYRGSG